MSRKVQPLQVPPPGSLCAILGIQDDAPETDAERRQRLATERRLQEIRDWASVCASCDPYDFY